MKNELKNELKNGLKNQWRFIAAMLLFMFLTPAAFSQEGILNKLLAPGPLVKGHQNLEKSECLTCHVTGQGTPDIKCLECHKVVKPFVDKKQGFHGLVTQSCRECHSDHKGRDNITMAVDEKNFDHKNRTGYSLDGKHQELKCAECHKAKLSDKFILAGKIRYLGEQATCVSCHKKDDIHHFKAPWAQKDCVACHSPSSWKQDIKFNHAKDTKYALEGKHMELKCADCHGPSKLSPKIIYKWSHLAKNQCLTCHADQHKKNLSSSFQGGKCTTCHLQQNNWKIEKFDHKITPFALNGKHMELKCQECHVQKDIKLQTNHANFKFMGLKAECLTCHKDFHRFGDLKTKHFGVANKCQSCHVESSWKQIPRFNHDKHTNYELTGEHAKLKCTDCHFEKDKKLKITKILYRFPLLTKKTCETCHASPHANQFSPSLLKKQCTECHVTTGWFDNKTGQSFDHSKTRFALTGAHKQISCADCHGEKKKQVFKFKSVEQKFCLDCHQNIHIKQFSANMTSENCTQCHSTENFKTRLAFNHNLTKYPLDGAHKELKCETCHTPTSARLTLVPPNISKKKKSAEQRQELILSKFEFPKNTKDNCLTCHADFHQTQLSSQCLNCHSINSWKQPRFNHNKQSDFVLMGKHQDLKCAECHKAVPGQFSKLKDVNKPVIRFKPISGQCLTCHKDVHQGNFGNNCRECHTEKGWKITKDFHKNFTLTGVHYALQCSECHTDNRKLSGLSQQCLTCHAKDDVHRGSLPKCQECHRQQFWEVTGFKHSLTQFPLRGVHRTLDCMECHRTGSYKGLNSLCSSCHLQQALSVAIPNHAGFGNLNSCNECHLNQFSWR